MQITINLPHVFHPGASALENAYVLRALLDMMIAVNRAYLRTHTVPALYRSGVHYARTKIWEPIPALYARRFGDCKSLATARIAELLEQGEPARPVFRWVKKADGGTDFHILVSTASGFEDPSRILGMGSNENAYFTSEPIE